MERLILLRDSNLSSRNKHPDIFTPRHPQQKTHSQWYFHNDIIGRSIAVYFLPVLHST